MVRYVAFFFSLVWCFLPLLSRQQPIAASVPMYVSGSADLHGSNKNYIAGGGDFGVNLGKR